MAIIPPPNPVSIPVPQPAPNPFERPNGQPKPADKGLDLWGAILRRKYLIILLALAGGATGYFQYTKDT